MMLRADKRNMLVMKGFKKGIIPSFDSGQSGTVDQSFPEGILAKRHYGIMQQLAGIENQELTYTLAAK